MNFWKNCLFGLTIAANCLIGLLLLFYDRFLVPPWLQVTGRMHPLFLHFPIVLLVISAAWVALSPRLRLDTPGLTRQVGRWLLLCTAFTSALTALMGLFLSKEPGYDPDALVWHKWSGVAVSVLTILWYYFYDGLAATRFVPVISLAGLVIILFTGHQGADITHGENFLLAPVTAEHVAKKPLFNDAVVFTDMVRPILDAKCMSCHNSNKAKGGLVMATRELLLKGGKSGKLWDSTKADLGLLFERIHLPEEEKKHMPPKGKPQLTEEEITILYGWVQRGADFTVKARDLPRTDTLRTIAANLFRSAGMDDLYDFSPAGEKTIAALNTNYRNVYPIAQGSPALAVDFYGPAFFKPDQLKELDKIRTQLVSLNLGKMPVTDGDLAAIRQFTNLRRLNLSFSKVTGSGLAQLANLAHLKDISLSNTAVTSADILKLTALKELRNIYVWNTGVKDADLRTIRKDLPGVNIDAGSRTDTMLVKLNPPILQNEEVIIDTPINLKLKHYVPGITMRYTLDGADPDSLSPIYNGHTPLSSQLDFRARAFKPGWLASDVVQRQFYHATFKPDTVILLRPTDSFFRGKGSKTLYNGEKGDLNLGSGKWLGFRGSPLACLMVFSHPVNAQAITLGSAVDTAGRVFPPQSIEVWGGNDPARLTLLTRSTPEQSNLSRRGYLTYFECRWKSTPVRYLRIVATPLAKLPPPPPAPPGPAVKPSPSAEKVAAVKTPSDPGKVKKAPVKVDPPPKGPKPKVDPKAKFPWFFVDELFVN